MAVPLTLRFYGELNIFLSPQRRKRVFSYSVKGHPSVKDTLEALGVPHTEIDCILINGKSVDWSYHIKGGERIFVYPPHPRPCRKRIKRLQPKPPACPKFILDVHLGKLARQLRLLGFDSLYDRNFTDPQIIKIAGEQSRVVLTRDAGLLKNKAVLYGYYVRPIYADKQMEEILKRFNLSHKIKAFSLCLECNGKVKRVAKAKIENRLPLETKQYYHKFQLCQSCGKVYWKGAHFDRLSRVILKSQMIRCSTRQAIRVKRR